MKLGIQAWAGDAEPSPDRFDPVTGPGQLYKPSAGGLWTSTWAEQTGSGWIDWCLDAEFRGPVFDVWLLTPDPTVRIYEIDSLPDLQRLVDLYPSQYTHLYDSPCVDWAEVATEWDAVHLTDEGQWRTRMTHPISLYGWDCESTLWFRWCFTEVSHYGEWKAAA